MPSPEGQICEICTALAGRSAGIFCACLEDVGLVDLVGHEDDVFLVRELDDVLQVLVRQALPRRVACTPHHECHLST